MPSASMIVDGTVRDATSSPIPEAVVWTTGLVALDCSSGGSPMEAEPDTATTDATGRFRMVLEADVVAGRHCVTFVVRAPGGSAADTSAAVAMDFRPEWEMPDTARIQLVIGGS